MKNLLLLTLLGASSAFGQGQAKRQVIAANVGTVQYGIASFYADKFEGLTTSTGEKFSQKKLTAAHNTLPLGTWIRVTNLRNKKTVIVRVNDRLHHRNTRLVDLSREAARRLGYISNGLAKVKVEVLGTRKPDDADEEDPVVDK
jgi:peptidoglycan lytic transglycosylase